MNKKQNSIAIIISLLLTCQVANSASTCNDFSGKISLSFDSKCRILRLPEISTLFSSAQFLGLCFSGKLKNGIWGSRSVTGTTLSGLTANQFNNSDVFTAVTALTLFERGREVGKIFLRDFGINNPQTGETIEQIVSVGGEGEFFNVSATIDIIGAEFSETGADVSGKVCTF